MVTPLGVPSHCPEAAAERPEFSELYRTSTGRGDLRNVLAGAKSVGSAGRKAGRRCIMLGTPLIYEPSVLTNPCRIVRNRSCSFLPARQFDDGGSIGGNLAAMRRSVLADLYQVLAVLDEFSGDDSVDENDVPVRIVAPDLAFALAQKTCVAHPVGQMVCKP